MSIEETPVYRKLGTRGTRWYLIVLFAGMFLGLIWAPVASFTPLMMGLPSAGRWTLRGISIALVCIGLAVLRRMYTSSMAELASLADRSEDRAHDGP